MFSSNTRKTREANFEGSPWGKNCRKIMEENKKEEEFEFDGKILELLDEGSHIFEMRKAKH